MDKEGLTLEQIKEIYIGKINDTYTLNLAVAMLENYDELLNKLEEKNKEIERLTNIVNKIEDMLQSPWNIECVNQNNEFLSKIKALKEGKENE